MGKDWMGRDDGFREATWTKGKQTIKGEYRYEGEDRFTVIIYKKDTISGRTQRCFTVCGDEPGWNGYKLDK